MLAGMEREQPGSREGHARLSGVLLAGGASRRMGRDKAWVQWGGEPLAVCVLRVLDEVCDDVVVASGDGRRLAALDRPQVCDAGEGRGPLAGLVAGLEAVRHDLVAVLAVDLPNAHAGVLRRLARSWRGEPAVVPEVDGRLEVLHAVWARAAGSSLRARLASGEPAVTAAARALGVRSVGPDVWGDLDATAGFAANLNSPGDLPSWQ